MKLTDLKILIVATDTEQVAVLAHAIVTRLAADLAIVDSVQEAQLLSETESYDVILASTQLADGLGRSLLSVGAADGTPVVMIEADGDCQNVLNDLRQGAADVLVGPIEVDDVVETICRVVRVRRERQVMRERNKRLRRISSRLIRDRRELRQRVDLICRDLVSSYRRLAQKVVVGGPAKAEPRESEPV